jgi:hypothetical protein
VLPRTNNRLAQREAAAGVQQQESQQRFGTCDVAQPRYRSVVPRPLLPLFREKSNENLPIWIFERKTFHAFQHQGKPKKWQSLS